MPPVSVANSVFLCKRCYTMRINMYEGYMMSKRAMKRLNLTMPHELCDRWDNVSKKLGLSKSAMLREMLESVLPSLEQDDINGMVSMLLSANGEVLKDLSRVIK